MFLKNGYQISDGALQLILTDPQKAIRGVSKLKPRPFIITEKHMKKIFDFSKKPKIEVKILKKYEISKKPIKIDDYVKHFLTRYEKIKAILFKRMGKKKLLSINKIPHHTTTFSLIGIIRQKVENKLLLEDPSGEILLSFDATMKPKLNEVNLDDVVGVTCKRGREGLFVKEIYLPEVPSSRDINKTEEEIRVAFLFDPLSLEKKQQEKLYELLSRDGGLSSVFVFAEGSVKQEELPNLDLIKISKKTPPTLFQIDEIKILTLPKNFFSLEGNRDAMNYIISSLRGRHLIGMFDPKIHVGINNFVLEDIPDIIVSDIDGCYYKNYKGTTIILNSDPAKFFLVNLKNREVLKKSIPF